MPSVVVSDQSPGQRDQSPKDVDQSPQPWDPNCLYASTSIHLSDSAESGPPDDGRESLVDGDHLDLDELLERLSVEMGSFEGYEASTAEGMLRSGSHPVAVLNKLRAQRSGL